MKFRVQYFLLPMLVLSAIFTFCTKEPQTPTAEITQMPASDRAICNVTVTVNSGAVSVCGTNLPNNVVQPACGNAFGEALFGTAILPAGGVGNYVINTASGPLTEGYLILTGQNGATTISATVTSGGGVLNLNLVPGVPRIVTISSLNCTPS